MKRIKWTKTAVLFLLSALIAVALVSCGGDGDPPGGNGTMSFYSELDPYTLYFEWEFGDELFEELPEAPTEAGYTFMHWVVGGSSEPLTLEDINGFAEDGGNGVSIYAKYAPNTDTPYKVNYYLESPDSDEYILRETVSLIGTSDATALIPEKSYGVYIKRDDYNLNAIDRYGMSEFNVYYDLPRYTVDFSLELVSQFDGLQQQRIKHGTDVEVPTVKRYGYKFLGFDKELTNVTKDLHVTALWELVDYTIEYEAGIGALPTGLPTTYNAEGEDINFAELPQPTPPSDDYRFIGWTNEAGVPITTWSARADRNVTLTAEYEYILEIENGTVVGLTDYGKTKASITIPLEYDGVEVTEIAKYAFAWPSDTLTSVVIPESVKIIREWAFYAADGIEVLVIPDTVELIEDGAIYSCDGLQYLTLPYLGETRDATENLYLSRALGGDSVGFNDSVLVPDKLRSVTVRGGALAEDSFKDLSKITSLNLSGITGGFSGKSLQGCESLVNFSFFATGYTYSGGVLMKDGKVIMTTTATLPENATGIAPYAFVPAVETALTSTEITSLTVPASVTLMENACLFGLNSLETLTLPFLGDASLFSSTREVRAGKLSWLFFYDDGIGQMSAPDSLTTVTVNGGAIFRYAFDGTKVSEVVLGNVDEIAECAFAEKVVANDHLIGVFFSSEFALNELPERMFYNCSALVTIMLPETVTAIGEGLLYGCSSLEYVYLPEGVTVIPANTFYGCADLPSINSSSDITVIGEYAFYGCTSLEFYGIPASVTAIADYTFYGCTSLGTVVLHSGITSIGKAAFRESGITALTIHGNDVSIGDEAFYGAGSLETVSWGGVTEIGFEAFSDCTSLASANLPSGVTSIGDFAFYGCSSLLEATVPATVTSLPSSVFDYCTGLVRLNLFPGFDGAVGDTPPEDLVASSFFIGCTSLTEIYIGEGSTCGGMSTNSIAVHSAAFKNLTLKKLHIGAGVFYIDAAHFVFADDATVVFEAPERLSASAAGSADKILPTIAGSSAPAVISAYFIENLGTYCYCENP